MIEKNVIICSAMNNKIIQYLSNYENRDIMFKFVKRIDSLKVLFKVYTNETDNEKLTIKIKELIKSTSFGAVLYFSVIIDS